MNCESFLHFLEKERWDFSDPAFQEHKKSCVSCQEKVLELIIKTKAQEAYRGIEAPFYLRGKILAALERKKPLQPFPVTFLKSFLVVALGILLLALSFQVFYHHPEIGAIQVEPYLEHVSFHNKRVPRHDRQVKTYEEVKQFLSLYALQEIPQLPEEAKLKSIALCEVENKKVVHVFYECDRQLLHLFIVPEKLARKGVFYEGAQKGRHALALSTGKMVCLFVSSLPSSYLKNMVKKVTYKS